MAAPAFEHPAISDFTSPPVLTGVLLTAMQVIVLWETRARTRAALQALPSERLWDLGLTTAEVLREVEKPFWRA